MFGPETGTMAEWATAVAATIALILSAAAFSIGRASERRRLFIDLHDRLTSPESQRGRRMLYKKLKTDRDIARMDRWAQSDFDVVNRTLGLYNTLGIYVHRKYVREDIALDHWAGRVRNHWPQIERFLVWRRTTHEDPTMWSYLVWFAELSGANVSPAVRLKDGWTERIPGHAAATASHTRPPNR